MCDFLTVSDCQRFSTTCTYPVFVWLLFWPFFFCFLVDRWSSKQQGYDENAISAGRTFQAVDYAHVLHCGQGLGNDAEHLQDHIRMSADISALNLQTCWLCYAC